MLELVLLVDDEVVELLWDVVGAIDEVVDVEVLEAEVEEAVLEPLASVSPDSWRQTSRFASRRWNRPEMAWTSCADAGEITRNVEMATARSAKPGMRPKTVLRVMATMAYGVHAACARK